ncbi:MAG: FAD-dependent oxidoreductase, partial [Erysipelotrichaceae bacterium]
GGISGLMVAHRLSEKNPNLSITLLEKGHDIDDRVCPIIAGKVPSCINCASCGVMEGLAGAGAFSDGKYIISTEYGGWLTDFLPNQTVLNYIEQADSILVKHGATTERYNPSNELKTLCLKHDLHMQQAQVKHLGTDANYTTMAHLVNELRQRIQIHTQAEVLDVDGNQKIVTYQKNKETIQIQADAIFFCVGRAGSKFFSLWCKKNKIPLLNNQVDIGVRVELPYEVWKHFSSLIYEPKIWFRGHKYGDVTRMFCFNEKGHVVMENTNDILTVNGHSFKEESKRTDNSNFALLSTIRFTTPFNDPIDYARHVARLGNLISGGSVLVQRFGDLVSGHRTDEKRLSANTVRPTLKAVAGDLSLCMPKRQLDNIIETIYALDAVAPGTANFDTLLYGVECKYYSARPETQNFELKAYKNCFAIGDGAGFTRSLSQAAAQGLYVADEYIKNLQLTKAE